MALEKLNSIITYILRQSPDGRTKLDLSKLLYYVDGVNYQRNAEQISKEKFIHLEDSPSPVSFNESILYLKENNFIDVLPSFNGSGITCFKLVSLKEGEDHLTKENKRIINKVLETYKNGVHDESKYYPNIYENYVITPLYSEIRFSAETLNTKIHIFKKKSLLSVSNKIFRVLFD